MKTLSEQERKRLLKQYLRREGINYHTENAITLVKRFGTKKEINLASIIKKKIEKIGYTPEKYDKWLYKHGHIHYSKLIK